MLESPNAKAVQDWSREGRWLLYCEVNSTTGLDLRALDMEYAVSRDGWFLTNQPVADAAAAPITLILNWRGVPSPATSHDDHSGGTGPGEGGAPMRDQRTLTVTSLISIFLFSMHWADEVARGLEPGTLAAVWGLVILGGWLSAALAFADRRPGLIVLLLAAVLASAVPVLHMQGRGLVGGRYANTDAMFFWVWTNIALGASGMVSAVLAARALWRLARHDRSSPPA